MEISHQQPFFSCSFSETFPFEPRRSPQPLDRPQPLRPHSQRGTQQQRVQRRERVQRGPGLHVHEHDVLDVHCHGRELIFVAPDEALVRGVVINLLGRSLGRHGSCQETEQRFQVTSGITKPTNITDVC